MASKEWQGFLELLEADKLIEGQIGVLASSLSRRLDEYAALRYGGIDFAALTDVIADPDVVAATVSRLEHVTTDVDAVKVAREKAEADVAKVAASLIVNAEKDEAAIKAAIIKALPVAEVEPVNEPTEIPTEKVAPS
jgi:hypothetical protein